MKLTKLLFATSIGAICAIFTGCAGNGNGTNTTSIDSTKNVNNVTTYTGNIAYVRMDSLMRGYGMFIDMSDEFAKKGKNIEADLAQRGRSLEKELADYQDKAQKGLITRFQSQGIEEGLQKKNQELMQFRDQAMGKMQQEEMVMMNTISKEIMDFLNEYNQQKKYSVIFQSTASNPILVADPALDITNEVLTELNKRYLDSKTKK